MLDREMPSPLRLYCGQYKDPLTVGFSPNTFVDHSGTPCTRKEVWRPTAAQYLLLCSWFSSWTPSTRRTARTDNDCPADRGRSEERRVGKGGVSTCRFGW